MSPSDPPPQQAPVPPAPSQQPSLLISRFIAYSPLRSFGLHTPRLDPKQAYQSPASSAVAFSIPPPSSSLSQQPAKKKPVKVETVSGWRKQDKAERDAGLTSERRHKVLIPLFTCDTCRIGVGPDQYEQELYLYPVYKQTECIGCKRTYFKEPTWLHICGGCARYKTRQLSELYLMVKPEYWLTNVLLHEEGQEDFRTIDLTNDIEILQVRRHLSAHMLAFYRFHLFLLCLHLHIPPALVFCGLVVPHRTTTRKKEPLSPPKQQQHPVRRKQQGEHTILPFGSFTRPLSSVFPAL